MKISNILKSFKKKKGSELLDKFNSLDNVKENTDVNEEIKVKTVETEQNLFFEEEIFWWEDNKDIEFNFEKSTLSRPGEIISKLKKTELFATISKDQNFKIDLYEGEETHLTVNWDSPYLELSSRRKFLKLINEVIKDFESMGFKTNLIHDHKRLNLSNRIGMKFFVGTGVERKIESKINAEVIL